MKNFKFMGLFALVLLVGLSSCGTKDTTIQENIDKILPAGLSTTVEKGVVTLSGEAENQASISTVTTAIKAIKGVKSLENNVTIAVPELVVPEVVIPKVDSALESKVKDALKDFPGVQFLLKDGQIDLSGEVLRSKLATLMQTLQGMGLKVNSTNLVKK